MPVLDPLTPRGASLCTVQGSCGTLFPLSTNRNYISTIIFLRSSSERLLMGLRCSCLRGSAKLLKLGGERGAASAGCLGLIYKGSWIPLLLPECRFSNLMGCE